ncbi:MAG: hypothetical protein WA277_05315 [Nitrospirota bacterium]
MKIQRKRLEDHFKISRSTYFEIFKDSNWPEVDAKVAEMNGGREIHIPSGEALRQSQALAYLSGEGMAINRTTLWRKETAGEITPVIITSNIKVYIQSDLDKLLKPFCYNLTDVTDENTPCQNNKDCKFKDCTWHGFFEMI